MDQDQGQEEHPEGREKAEVEGKGEVTAIDISFLSTARAGTVIVRESELERAVRALELDGRVDA